MSDNYSAFVNSVVGARLARSLGLPRPSTLRRHEPGAALIPGPVLVGGHGAAPVAAIVRGLLATEGVEVVDEVGDGGVGGVVVDVTEVAIPQDLESARALLSPALRVLGPGGRVIVVGRPPLEGGSEGSLDPARVAARRAVEGLVRSIGKELRGGGTANLVHVARGADGALGATLRFLLSGRSAYVSGQVLTVGAAGSGGALRESEPAPSGPAPHRLACGDRPLAGKVAIVTGAARGIGAAIAAVLARDGASVVCVDLEAAGDALSTVATDVGGVPLAVDVTAVDAGAQIVARCAELGGLDVVVHNAGITRDRLLVNTDAQRWAQVIDVNLESVLRMNGALLGAQGLRDGGRVVLVSSTSGIAGNRGQANYAASKAGVIGVVQALARDHALIERGITVNAVAPGFIETEMTARIPLLMREVGRRINSLAQGGLPVDVAEAVAYFAQPASGAVTGNVLRVCGQSQLGA